MTDRLRYLDALFAERVLGTGECWLWTGPKHERGYGMFWADGRSVRAHRYTYERVYGEIPDGTEIDHVCRVTSCVNPAHLRAVSHRENVLAGVSFSAKNAAKKSCPHGHPYSLENTVARPKGHRECLICKRERGLRWWRKRHA